MALKEFSEKADYLLGNKRIKAYKEQVDELNYKNFLNFLVFCGLSSLPTSLICFALQGIVDISISGAWGFLALFFFATVLWLIAFFPLKKHHRHILPLFYAIETCILGVGIALGTFLDPNHMAITFVLMLNLLPIFILDYHWRCWSFQILLSIAFIVSAYFSKDRVIFGLDLTNTLLFLFTGIGISFFTQEDRITNLENSLRLKKEAEVDLLTGLLNRGTGVNKLTALVNNHKAGCFAIADLDDFKSINDAFGHMTGDEALIMFSKMLKNFFGKGDNLVIRLGGDEFALWLNGDFTFSEVEKDLSLLIQLTKEIRLKEQADYLITSSVGCSISDGLHFKDFNELYAIADKALYRAKREGKGRYVIEGFAKNN